MKLRNSFAALLLVTVLIISSAHGQDDKTDGKYNVAYKSGSFDIGYTDISYLGGLGLKIKRVYKSDAERKSIFGWNWGCEYDISLETSADGNMVINELGGADQRRFTPENFNLNVINMYVPKALSIQMVSPLNFLLQKYTNLTSERELSVGGKVFYNRCGCQDLTRIRQGYLRYSSKSETQYFDQLGRLSRISDKNGNYIGLSYDNKGRLQTAHGCNKVWFNDAR